MKSIAPSKQFIKIFGTTVAILTITTVAVLTLSSNKTNVDNPIIVAASQADSLFEIDTDQDGIADWEEALWGTSPYKPDSDGDGQSDFIYIETLRAEKAKNSNFNPNTQDNETQILAKQLFATTIAFQEKGLSSVQAFSQVAQTLGDNVQQSSQIPDFYDESNIIIDPNIEDLKYAQNIFAIMSPFKDQIGSDLFILNNVRNKRDASLQLQELAKMYSQLEEETAAVAVPPTAAQYHARLLNTYFKFSVAANNLAEFDTNPIIGFIGLSQHKEQSDQFTQLLAAFQ